MILERLLVMCPDELSERESVDEDDGFSVRNQCSACGVQLFSSVSVNVERATQPQMAAVSWQGWHTCTHSKGSQNKSRHFSYGWTMPDLRGCHVLKMQMCARASTKKQTIAWALPSRYVTHSLHPRCVESSLPYFAAFGLIGYCFNCFCWYGYRSTNMLWHAPTFHHRRIIVPTFSTRKTSVKFTEKVD